MKFDWTVTVGTIIHLLGMVCLFAAGFYKLKLTMEHQGEFLNELRADVKEIKNDLLRSLERRVGNLEVEIARRPLER
jgi:hypothetical protein